MYFRTTLVNKAQFNSNAIYDNCSGNDICLITISLTAFPENLLLYSVVASAYFAMVKILH